MTNLLQFADVPEWGAGRHWSWFMALLLGDDSTLGIPLARGDGNGLARDPARADQVPNLGTGFTLR